MNNLYDLTKKIDALTYNAQQVLNALVRSCIASGSSNGYTIRKYGNDITLDRQDIYRLYNFYESWKIAGFPADETTFYRMLAEADARWRSSKTDTSTLATDAVVKHMKMMTMNASDKAKNGTEYNDYWTEKLRESASPNATVASAPIPINLRTPLYDENLSVKSFSQYETYLFPMGYYRNEIMGTPDNGESYLAGGENWTIDVTEMLTLSARHIVAGNVTNPQNRLDNYGESRITASWGNESYAVGDVSLAIGDHSLAVAPGSIAAGNRVSAYGERSAALGGDGTVAAGYCSLSCNRGTVAGGSNSIAGNWGATTGGWEYQFTLVADATQVTTEATECDTGTVAEVQTAITRVLKVSANEANNAYMEFDLKAGDTVYLYGLSFIKDGITVQPADDDGYARQLVVNRILSVTPTLDTNGNVTEYQVALENAIEVDSPEYGPVSSGYIAAAKRPISFYNDSGVVVKADTVELGRDSAALNHFTLASGVDQTVVGSMNYRNYEARFIVGTGSSYIFASDGSDIHRANSLVISPRYSYMKLDDGKASIGVSGGNRVVQDEEKTILRKGAFMMASGTDSDESVMVTDGKQSSLYALKGGVARAHIGVTSDAGLYSGSGTVSAIVSSLQGVAVISSGSYVQAGTATGNLVDTLLAESRVINAGDNSLALYSESGVDIRSVGTSGIGIGLETASYLSMRFSGMLLRGDTFGSLTANEDARSFWLYSKGTGNTGRVDDVKWAETSGHSGFYFGRLGPGFGVSGATGNWAEDMGVHVINSTIFDNDLNMYNTATLAIPCDDYGVKTPHPIVSVHEYHGVGNNNSIGDEKYVHELAYTEDLDGISAQSCGQASMYGYNTTTSSIERLGVMPVMVRKGQSGQWYGRWDNSGTLDGANYCYWAVSAEKASSYHSTNEYSAGLYIIDPYKIVGDDWGPAFASSLYDIRNFTYSLTGQDINISFNITIKLSNESRLTGQNGLLFPLMLGTETAPCETGWLTDKIWGYSAGSQLITMLSGTARGKYDVSTGSRSPGDLRANGVAFQDGTIVIHIVTSSTESSFNTGGNTYYVKLHGMTPFKATPAGCSDDITVRNSAIRKQAFAKHLTYKDWCTGDVPGDSDAPDTNGTLYRTLQYL